MERNTDGPAQPEQRDEGFETGQDRPGRTRSKRSASRTSRAGSPSEPVPGTEEHGDFATRPGALRRTPKVERRFSEGQEESPTSS